VDPFLKKEWYDIKAPGYFKTRKVGKTLITRTTGTKIASEGLKGRVFEVNLAELQGGDEEQGYRKFQLVAEDVKGTDILTNFHGMDLTRCGGNEGRGEGRGGGVCVERELARRGDDGVLESHASNKPMGMPLLTTFPLIPPLPPREKLNSLIKKWQTLIDAHVEAKTTDGYTLRLFAVAFTKRVPGQVSKAAHAQAAQVRAIRKKIVDIIKEKVVNNDLKELVKLL
jgi:small subunit ribosomal protein S3Ae